MSPISAAIANASSQPIPGTVSSSGIYGGSAPPRRNWRLTEVDLGVDVVDQREARLDSAAPRLGNRAGRATRGRRRRTGQHVQHALRLLANTSLSPAVVVIATGAPPSPSRRRRDHVSHALRPCHTSNG